MKTIWVFFRKDSRALWWAIAPALVLYAALVLMDSRRHGSVPGLTEGWGYVIVPLAWVFLLGLAVLEDPPLQRRQFWLATPCRPDTLLAAKALFAVCWVHVPYLIGCCLILAARGFAPWEDVPQLLWKQAAVLAVVTLPAIAAASVVASVSQLLVLGIAAIGVVPYAVANLLATRRSPIEEDVTEAVVLSLLLALGSALVILAVYGFRRAVAGRVLGLAAVAGLAVVAVKWTLLDSLRLEEYFPAEPLTRTGLLVPAEPDLSRLPEGWKSGSWRLPGRVDVFLPAAFTGLRSGEVNWDLDNLSITLTGNGGERVQVGAPAVNGDPGSAGAFGLFAPTGQAGSSLLLCLNIPEHSFRRLQKGRVLMEGYVRVSGNLLGEAQSIKPGVRKRIAGLGVCDLDVVPVINGTQFARELSAACGSTRRIPPFSEVRSSWSLGRSSRPKHLVDRSGRNGHWEFQTWLSPVYRAETGWGTSTLTVREPDDLSFEIRPSRSERSQLVRFRAAELDLSRYTLAHQPAGQD